MSKMTALKFFIRFVAAICDRRRTCFRHLAGSREILPARRWQHADWPSSTALVKDRSSRSLDQVKEISFAILEEEHSPAASCRFDWFCEHHAALFKFLSRGFD